MLSRQKLLSGIKRLVVKIGTSILTGPDAGLDSVKIGQLTRQVLAVKQKGIDAVIVSSGAIGAGMAVLGLTSRPSCLSKKQAAAAIGQIQLMNLYDKYFKSEGCVTAQVLLTGDDFTDKARYLNAKHTLFTILDYKAVPIINENDTVSTDEIKFGDNDKLSGLVCNMLGAGLLVILSDVDGLLDEGKELISIVNKITPAVERLAKGTTKQSSTGGMITKIQAAKAQTARGGACIIANGNTRDILLKIVQGEDVGTLFLPVSHSAGG